MKSLFLKIFLSFWAALALFLVLAILVTLAFRPRTSSWEALLATATNDSVDAYEQGGKAGLQEYLQNLERTQHVRVYLFNENLEEVAHRGAPEWALRVAGGGPRVPHEGFIFPTPPPVLRDSRASSDGLHRYTLVLSPPPGPRLFLGPRGLPIPGLIILFISSGLVCYVLAKFLTRPIVRLRAATRKLAAGDLTARAGAPNVKRRDEVAGLMRDFDTMAERLENLVKAQSRLLNDISHELRSPLARLNVALGLARQRSGSESAAMLERIELEAGRLNELIGRLLTLARLEDGEHVASTPVLLDEVVLGVAEDAEFEAQARHCHVRGYIPGGTWAVSGDASLLHSAIENVVRNAIRYTREGSTVEIHLEKTESRGNAEAIVRVTDCGSGVPEDALEKLFQPFYRLDDARGRQTGGVGLGLAITERAVRFHGGRVSAANRAEGGLMVEIRLPMLQAIAGAEELEPVPAGGVVPSE